MGTKSITTKLGDKGLTRLFSGEEVAKDSPRLECYGDVDELVSILGIARQETQKKKVAEHILFIQKALFKVASELATTEPKVLKLKERVNGAFLEILENRREALEKKVPFPSGFILPANSKAAAYLDHARTVARRAERKVVGLLRDKTITNDTLLVWFNRLSDFLYLLARFEEETPLYVNPSTPRRV